MIKRSIMLAMLAMTASACGGSSGNNAAGASADNEAANASAPISNAQAAVRDLPEGQRNGVMFRAIRDARQPCQNVRESTLSEAGGSTPVYMATCDDGSVYAIAIRDDGVAAVRPVMPAEGAK